MFIVMGICLLKLLLGLLGVDVVLVFGINVVGDDFVVYCFYCV